MTTDQLLMRWAGIPIAKINNAYRDKLIKKMHKEPTKQWYGYTTTQWITAFNAKSQVEQQTRQDNLLAIEQIAQMRRRKFYETNRAATKLLLGICKYANI
jgi:ribonuclease HII